MNGVSYWLGQSVQLRGSFLGEGRAPLDVTGVAFEVRRPDGTTAAVPAEAAPSQGLWLGYVTADQVGVWRVRLTCTGPRPAVDEGEFRVKASTVG